MYLTILKMHNNEWMNSLTKLGVESIEKKINETKFKLHMWLKNDKEYSLLCSEFFKRDFASVFQFS